MIRCKRGGELITRPPCPIHDHKYTGNWIRIRGQVLDRDHHRCTQCGAPCPHPKHHHVDHISHSIPDRDALTNLRTVCARFNLSGQRSCK